SRGAPPGGPAAAGGRRDHGHDLPRAAPGDRGPALPGLRPPHPTLGSAQAGPRGRRLPPGPLALTPGSTGGNQPPQRGGREGPGGRPPEWRSVPRRPGDPAVAIPPPSGHMRAAVTTAPGVIRLEQRPTPAIGPGEILVRVRGCGLCGSDLAKLRAPSRLPAV